MSTWHMCELAARDKAGVGPDWEAYSMEVLPHNRRRGTPCVYHVSIGVPRLLISGPHKGRKCWDGPRQEQWLGEAEVDARAAQYEQETGECCECLGAGKTVASSGVSGTTYRECSRCGGSGKAARS